ncbi:MAG: glycosyltransferase family 2 protein [Akkermansiaceae bacterium]|nr:glycosyltransferase family 2 protein [Akkermansiaceae bacterium]
MPHFSIITICRNEEAGIRETCESIVSQTFEDFEWIIIDGGSTDGTLDILSDYEEHISSLVSEPDEGLYDAMNKGIAKASGAYLIFMNGGDRFASEKALEWASTAPDKDLLYGDVYHDSPDGPLITYPDKLPPGYLLSKMIPHQATFYRRELFEQHGDYDTSFRIAADYDLYARLLELGKVSYHHIPKPLAVFSLGGISSSPGQRRLRKRENHRVRMKYFPRYRWSLKALRESLRNWRNRSASK